MQHVVMQRPTHEGTYPLPHAPDRDTSPLPHSVMRCLPAPLRAELAAYRGAAIEELRLHGGGQSAVRIAGRLQLLDTRADRESVARTLDALCGGSLYAHTDTLAQGYLTTADGVRVGVCGRLRRAQGATLTVSDVSSLIFRLPRPLALPVDDICHLLRTVHPGRGVLLYAPPGGGKTTLLRALIRALAAPPHPTALAVVDTREELCACGTGEGRCIDWLIGYPRAVGIDIATRTLGAAMVVCDELGDEAETRAIGDACHAGVVPVASAHATDLVGLLRRDGLRRLHEAGVFGSYIGLSRTAGAGVSRRITPARDVSL